MIFYYYVKLKINLCKNVFFTEIEDYNFSAYCCMDAHKAFTQKNNKKELAILHNLGMRGQQKLSLGPINVVGIELGIRPGQTD